MIKKIISCILLTIFSTSFIGVNAAASPMLNSDAVCVIDAKTGQVLFEKQMDVQLAPASITKIMTTLLAIEKLDPDTTLIASYEDINSLYDGVSHIALQVGEQLSLEQTLMATMLPSANDAANMLASAVSGNHKDFAALMTSRAAELGAKNTKFINSNGLDEPEHKTTAYDMAIITKEAIKNEEFRRIFSTKEYTIPPTNMQSELRNIGAGNAMVFEFSSYYNEEVIGGKSGYTDIASHTLVTLAKRGDREIITVIMAADKKKNMYNDTQALIDYGFSGFEPVEITPNDLSKPSTTPMFAENTVVYLSTGLTKEDITKKYSVLSTSPDKVEVLVTLGLSGASGLQYANLGEVTLYYAGETADSFLPAPPEDIKGEEEIKTLGNTAIDKIVLIVRLSLTAVFCIAIVTVLTATFVRVYYKIKKEKSRANRRK